MPQLLNATTKQVKQIWQSPDGQRTIHEVTFDYQGQPFKANTFSDDIAVLGWNGDIETYERPGKNGSQTFVKQAPKENPGFTPKPSGQGNAGSTSGYTPRDDSHIKAQWAIGQAIIICHPEWDNLKNVEEMAKSLFDMVDRVKVGTPAEQPDVIQPVDDGPVDMSQLDAVFGPSQQVATRGETQWTPGS